jgi:hypothetical protein
MNAPFLILCSLFLISLSVHAWEFDDKTPLALWKKLFHQHRDKLLIPDVQFLHTLNSADQKSFTTENERIYWDKHFTQNPNSNEICHFPARYYLWSKGKKNPEVNCSALAKFMSEFDVQKMSIVFSSYYAQNSASLFGHTLLRFTRFNNKGQELLDWGISYSADMADVNPLSMVYKSFFSTFRGSLELMPYYYKVREYNDFEFRPLWSYTLKVTPEQIKFILYHIWELSRLNISYQYLTHNCSSLILDILNILKPESHFREGLAFYHIPIDTIKVLKKEGLLEEQMEYRASLMEEWESKFRLLNNEEKKIFYRFSKNLDDSELTSPLLLDTALEYYDFKYGKELLSEQVEWKELRQKKNNLLIKRSKYPNSSYDPITAKVASPDLVHPTRRLGLGYLFDDYDRKFIKLNYRFAYHDPFDPTSGMTSRMKINFMQPEITINEDGGVRFEKLELLDLASWSYSPILSHALTYEMGAHWLRQFQKIDENHKAKEIKTTRFSAAVGRTFDLGSRVYTSIMLDQELTFSNDREDAWGMKVGPKWMIHWDQNDLRLRLTAKKIFEITGYQKYDPVLNHVEAIIGYSLSKNQVVSWVQNYANDYNQSILQWSYYY